MTEKEASLSTVSLQLSSDDGSVGINQYPTDNGQRIDLSANIKYVLDIKKSLLEKLFNANIKMYTIHGEVDLELGKTNYISLSDLDKNQMMAFNFGVLDLTEDELSILDLMNFSTTGDIKTYLISVNSLIELPNTTMLFTISYDYEKVSELINGDETFKFDIIPGNLAKNPLFEIQFTK